jgi:hypothetical protein
MTLKNREHARRVLKHLGVQLRECDGGCGRQFTRDELTAVGAGIFMVCSECAVPPVVEPVRRDDGEGDGGSDDYQE